MRLSKAFVALFAVGLMLTACSMGTSQKAAGPQEAGVASPTPTMVSPTQTPEQEAPATEAFPPTETPPPLESDEIPKGSSALKASPPGDVSLTGERPRLIEFFAFW